jgi:tetratricopeptide (TPR) repeat protein
MKHSYGEMHSDVAYENELLANVLRDQGDLEGAREHYQRAVDIYAQVAGPTHEDTLWATIALGDFYGRVGKCGEASRVLTPTLALFEAAQIDGGVALAEVALARCALQRNAAAEARRRLEHALTFFERLGAPADRGEARFELARALLATGTDEARALAVARQAEQELAQSGALGARDLERARKWLRRFAP